MYSEGNVAEVLDENGFTVFRSVWDVGYHNVCDNHESHYCASRCKNLHVHLDFPFP